MNEEAKMLAGLVLDWASCDDVVAKKGWDGGSLDERWDETRKKMVDLARDIVGRSWVSAQYGRREMEDHKSDRRHV